MERHHDALMTTCLAVLGELHDLVWAPLGTHLAELGRTDLIIVPHGPLHRLPFHALFDGTQASRRRLDPLGRADHPARLGRRAPPCPHA